MSPPPPDKTEERVGLRPGGTGEDLTGKVFAGRYEVIESIARGGMGEVWLAKNGAREVALKILRDDIDPGIRSEYEERFVLEAEALARLSHPNIVSICDCGFEAGVPYVVMELLDGLTLGGVFKTGGMDPIEAIRIGAEIAEGLHCAHESGIVHRDVKPNNIMLVKDRRGRNVPMLLDFGLAKVLTTHGVLTNTGETVGSPLYMSPEQVQGLKSLDRRSDVYSLGCLLFRCLAGRPPYKHRSLFEIRLKHVTDPIPRLGVDSLPLGIDAVIERALQKDPADRYQTAREMADALRACLPRPALSMESQIVLYGLVLSLVFALVAGVLALLYW